MWIDSLVLVAGLALGAGTGAAAPSQGSVIEVARRCALPARYLDAVESCEGCTTSLRVAGHEVVGFWTWDGGTGRHATHRKTYWAIYPVSCRAVGLELVLGGGSPWLRSSFMHLEASPITDAERASLLSWAGHVSADRNNRADAMRFTPWLPRLSTSGDSTPVLRVSAPSRFRWRRGRTVSQRESWALIEETEGEADEDGDRSAPVGYVLSGPRYSIFWGQRFVEVQERSSAATSAGGYRVRLYGNRARDETYVIGLEDERGKRVAWVAQIATDGAAPRLLGMHAGMLWFEIPAYMEPGFTLLAVDPRRGRAWQVDPAPRARSTLVSFDDSAVVVAPVERVPATGTAQHQRSLRWTDIVARLPR